MKVIRKNIASAKTMPYLVLIRMNVRSCGFSSYMQGFYFYDNPTAMYKVSF